MSVKESYNNAPTQDRSSALVWPAPKHTPPGAVIISPAPPPFEHFYEIWGVRDDGMMECFFRNTREEFLLFADRTNDPEMMKIAEMYRVVWKKAGLI